MSIATEITRLQNAKSSLKTSIENKGVTVPDTTKLDGYSDLVDQISTGSQEIPKLETGVNFIDYDGRIVATWTPEQTASATALPNNPDHTSDIVRCGKTISLTAEGWNWTLQDVKDYMTTYPDGVVWVGQTYHTTDGKDYLLIKLSEERKTPTISIQLNGTCVIDWGDNTTSTISGSSVTTNVYASHIYQEGGEYLISLDVTGNFAITGGSSKYSYLISAGNTTSNLDKCYQVSLYELYTSEKFANMRNYAFTFCRNLRSITLSKGLKTTSSYMFYLTSSLEAIVFPNSVKAVGDATFSSCMQMSRVSFASTFNAIGADCFNGCRLLKSITIPFLVTKLGDRVLSTCLLDKLILPNTLTEMRTVLTENVTLMKITIPSGVSLVGNVFGVNCLKEIKFTAQTPNPVSSSTTFANLPTDCIIYVPRGTLSAYTSATNYPSSATYTYVEY